MAALLGTAACSSPAPATPPPADTISKPHVDSAVDTVKPNDSIIKG